MKKTNKLFAAFLMVALATSGCSLLPNKPQSHNKSSKEESSQIVQDDFDAKTHEIYELYRANGGTLTYEEWLESIKGEKGDQGIQGEKGDKGDKGDQGDQGVAGPSGVDGQTPYIGNNGNWWIANQDTGVCAGGQNGVSIVSTVINSEGELIITFSDGTSQNAGRLTYTEHIHEYESNVVNPTCTVDGYITFTCKTCGHIETVVNKAQGHVFEAWRESIPATCYSNGLKVRYCSMCGERQQETIPMHDHTVSSACIHNTATHWNYCEECGVVLNEHSHTYVDGVCSVCGYVLRDASSESGMIYSLNSDGESYTLADFGSCELTDIEIPALYNGKPVTAIGNGAFSGTSITSITMTDNITSIGGNCFKSCSELISVALSKNITRIESFTFYYCQKLTNINIPNGVTYIGERAFSSCSSLTTLILPNSVTSIGYSSVSFCNSLQKVVLSSNLSTFSAEAFYYCPKLVDLTIPEGCQNIGSWGFRDCSKLESVYIPSSIKSIGYSAFYGTSLTSAVFADPTNWRVESDPIAKEILQDDAVAARKLSNSESNWYHGNNN